MQPLDRANPPPPTEASLVYLKVRGGEPLPIRRAAAESFATIKNMLDDTGRPAPKTALYSRSLKNLKSRSSAS